VLSKSFDTGSAVGAASEYPFRVIVVDDSAVIRGTISRWLDADPDIEVVTTAANGLIAVQSLKRCKAEVVVLDIEMPEMDGMAAIPELLKIDPDLQIIMASTLTARNADISLRALSIGAADYIPKPVSSRDSDAAANFRRELLEKVKTLAGARRRKTKEAPLPRPVSHPAPAAETPKLDLAGDTPIRLRPPSPLVPLILAIGSSTGGPQALISLFAQLSPRLSLPVLITQHMPPTFTTMLAEHLQRVTTIPCSEAVDGEELRDHHIFIAPGDYHMTVRVEETRKVIRLDQRPPVNYCRPSVDPMLQSLVEVYGGRVLTVILTGMGQDGLEGGRAVTEAGGTVVAQDESTSVVWGMPGAVATHGLCSAVLPLDRIGPEVEKLVLGR